MANQNRKVVGQEQKARYKPSLPTVRPVMLNIYIHSYTSHNLFPTNIYTAASLTLLAPGGFVGSESHNAKQQQSITKTIGCRI